MIRMKNILAENMNRFGTKNLTLTESDIQPHVDNDLRRSIKEQNPESLEMQGVDTADKLWDTLNDLTYRVQQLEKSIQSDSGARPGLPGKGYGKIREQNVNDTQTKDYHEIEDYLMSLQPSDVKIISGKMSLEDIEEAAAENRFTGDGSFDTDMVIETPEHKIGLHLTASASGGSDYGFVDAEVDIEFSVTGYTDKATNQQFKIKYTQPYTSKHRNFDYDMLELLGLL